MLEGFWMIENQQIRIRRANFCVVRDAFKRLKNASIFGGDNLGRVSIALRGFISLA